jgi:hypothetical protein
MRTFKTAFYSLSAATLLSSSAFAATDAIEVRMSGETAVIESGTKFKVKESEGIIDLFKVAIDNDGYYAQLVSMDFNITTQDERVNINCDSNVTKKVRSRGDWNDPLGQYKTETADMSFIKEFVIYREAKAQGEIDSQAFSDPSTTADENKAKHAITFNDQGHTNDGQIFSFANTNAAATVYIVALKYDTNQIDDKITDGNFTIRLDKVYYKDRDSNGGALSTVKELTTADLTVDGKTVEIPNVEKSLMIDTIAPKLFHEYVNVQNASSAINNYDAVIEQVEKEKSMSFYNLPKAEYDLKGIYVQAGGHNEPRHYDGDINFSNDLVKVNQTGNEYDSYTYNNHFSYNVDKNYDSIAEKNDTIGKDFNVIVRFDEKLDIGLCSINNSKADENRSNYLETLNNAFDLKDSLQNPLNITDAWCYTTCLSQKRVDPGEAKELGDFNVTGSELHLVVSSSIGSSGDTCESDNTIAVGDVTLGYNNGYLKDDFENYSASFSGYTAYDDQRVPRIRAVEVDFLSGTKGQIVFDEPIEYSVDAYQNALLSGEGDFNTTNRDLYKVTRGLTLQSSSSTSPIKIDFESTDASQLNDQLSLRFTDALSDKVGNKVNGAYNSDDKRDTNVDGLFTTSNIVGYREGNFTTSALGVYIVPDRWNLISVPRCRVTTSKRLSQSGTVQTIWGFKDDTWTKSPKLLEAGNGYWVKTLPINKDDFAVEEGTHADYNSSGYMYNSQIEDATTFDKETNNVVTEFFNIQTTGYNGTYIDSNTILRNQSSTDWKLLGIDKAISWSNAHSQVPGNCQTLSIFQYSPLGQTCTGGTCGSWNAAPYIPSYSGLWVRQENCD